MRKGLLVIIFFIVTFVANTQVIITSITTPESCQGANDGKATVKITFPAGYNQIQYFRINPLATPPVDFISKNISTSLTSDSVQFLNLPGQKSAINVFLLKSAGLPLNGTDTVNITPGVFVDAPVAHVGSSTSDLPVCEGTSIKLFAQSTLGTGYFWDGPNGFSSTTQNPQINNPNVSDFGTYNVYATKAGNQGKTCHSDTSSVTPVLVSVPDPEFTYPMGVCLGSTVNATLTNPVSGVDTYAWKMPNGTPSSSNSSTGITVDYATQGTKTITLTVTKSGCSDSVKHDVEVKLSPTASLTSNGSSQICAGAQASLKFSFTGASTKSGPYYFTYSDGTNTFLDSSNTSTKLVSVTVGSNTTYTLISVNDQGCSGSVSGSVNVTVNPLPVVSLTIPQTVICENASPISLTGSPISGGIGVYSVNATNMPSNSFDPSLYGTGVKTLKYTFTDVNGCIGTDTKSISVVGKPTVTINFTPTTVCTNASPISLTGTPSGGTFSGTGVSGSQFDPNTLPIATYPLSYTYNDISTGCSNTATKNVTIVALPTVTLTIPVTSICENAASVTLTGNPAGGVFSGPGVAGAKFDPVASGGSGVKSITYTYTDGNNCTNSQTKSITVLPKPVVDITTAKSIICSNDTLITLKGVPIAPPGTGVYTAKPLSTVIVSGNKFDPSKATSPGNYTIVYNYTSTNTCSNSDSLVLTVVSKPTVTLNAIPSQCKNSPVVTLVGSPTTGGVGVYSGNGVSGNTFDPKNSSVTAGTMPIKYLFVDNNGCRDSVSRSVTIFNAPTGTVAGGNKSICIGKTSTFTLAFTGKSPWSYTYTDGTTNVSGSTSTNPLVVSVSPTSTKTYTLVSLSDGNCSSGILNGAVTITVNPLPVLDFTQPTSPLCVSASPITLVATPSGGTFSTVPVAAITGTQFDPSKSGAVGTKTITYSYTDGSGCSATTTRNIEIKPQPTATFSLSTTSTCINSNVIVTYTGNSTASATYSWNFDSPSSVVGTGQGPYTVQWMSGGNKNVTLAVTEYSCTSTTVSNVVNIKTPPTASISGSKSICFGDSAVLGIALTGVAPFNYVYTNGSSNFSGTTSNASVNIKVGPNSSTTYSMVSVSDATCSSGLVSGSAIITINPLPVITFGNLPMKLCEVANPVTLNANPSGGTFSTTPSAAISGSQFDPTLSGGLGVKTITYTYTDGNGCKASAQSTLEIMPRPTATFTLTPGTVCVNSNVIAQYTGNSTATATYSWGFDSPSVSSGSGLGPYTLQWNTSGTKNVTLTVSEYSCSSVLVSNSEVVKSPPSAIISGNSTICKGDSTTISISFTGTAPFSYTFTDGSKNFSGSTSSNTINIKVGPTINTSYNMVTVSDAACSVGVVSGTAMISINPLPVITFGNLPMKLCEVASPVTLNASPVGGVFTMTPASAISGNVFDPTLSGGVGVKTITYTFTDVNGCTSSAQNTLEVMPKPTSTFLLSPSTSCVNSDVKITYTGNSTSAATYSWNFDSPTGQSGSGQGPYMVQWNTSGTKNISLTVTEYSCSSDLSTNNVSVTSQPTAIISGNQTVCKNDSATITLSFTGQTPWNYTYNDGVKNFSGISTGATKSIKVSPTSTTNYSLVSVSDANCGAGTVSGLATITINQLPVITFTNLPMSICETAPPVALLANPSGGTYSMSPAIALSGDIFDPSLSGGIGIKNVTYTFTDAFGCTSVATSNLTVTERPTAKFTVTPSVCVGENATVSYTGNAGTTAVYHWDFDTPSNTTGTGKGPYTLQWASSGNKKITLIVDEFSCSSIQGLDSIDIKPLPTAAISGDQGVCQGNNATLQFTFTGKAPWNFIYTDGSSNFNGIANSSPFSVTVPVAGNTDFSLVSVSDGNTCNSALVSGTAKITVVPKPSSDFILKNSACVNSNVNIDYATSISPTATYLYDFGSGTVISGSNSGPYQVSWANSGVKTVKLVVNESSGCLSDTTIKTISIDPPPTLVISHDTTICEGLAANVKLDFTGKGPFSAVLQDLEGNFYNVASGSNSGFDKVTVAKTTTLSVVSVTDANCTGLGSGNSNITLKPAPTATIGNDTVVCAGQTALLKIQFNGTGPFNYSYSDGTTVTSGNSTASSVDVLVSPSLTTKYKIVTLSDALCTGIVSDSALVTVIQLPVADFTIAPAACEGLDVDVVFTGSASPLASYVWNFDGGNVSNAATGAGPYKVNWTTSNTYAVTLSINDNGCGSSLKSSSIIIKQAPEGKIVSNDTIICERNNALLRFEFNGLPPFSYIYSDGITNSTIQTSNVSSFVVPVKPKVNSTYTLISMSDLACSASSLSGSTAVTLKPSPTPDFVTKQQVCKDEVLNVKYVGVNNGTAVFDWHNFDNAFLVSGAGEGPYLISFETSGSKNIKLTVSENGCSDSLTVPVEVNPVATAELLKDTSICQGSAAKLSINFTGKAPFQYIMSGVSGIQTSNTFNQIINVSPTSTTTYTIQTLGDSNACPGKITIPSATVTVNEIPQFTFTGKTEVCRNDSAEVYVNVTQAQLPWIANINISNPASSEVRTGNSLVDTLRVWVSQDATITLNLTDANKCNAVSTGTLSVKLRDIPVAGMSLDDKVCTNTITSLLNTLPPQVAYTYKAESPNAIIIDNGDGNFDLEWPVSGSQKVKYTVFDGICFSNVVQDSILVVKGPDPVLTLDKSTICEGDSVVFNLAFFGQKAYDFKFSHEGDVVQEVAYNSDIYSVKKPVLVNGQIDFEFIKDQNGCINQNISLPYNITINPTPDITFLGLDPVYCIDNPFVFVVASDPVTYDLSALLPGTFQDNKDGSFEFYPNLGVTGTFPFGASFTNAFGCTSSITENLNVVDAVDAGFTVTKNNCNDLDSIKLDFATSFGKLSSVPTTLSFNPVTGVVYPKLSSPGRYVLTHTLPLASCPSGTFTDTVYIRPLPQRPTFVNSRDSIICRQTRLTTDYAVVVSDTTVKYSWNFKNSFGTIVLKDTMGRNAKVTWNTSSSLSSDTLRINAKTKYCSVDTMFLIKNDVVNAEIFTATDSIQDDQYVKVHYSALSNFPMFDTVFVSRRTDFTMPWNVTSKQQIFGDTVLREIPTPATSVTAWEYRVGVKNYCLDTVYSPVIHKTILTKANADEKKGEIYLKFNPYSGWVPQKYEVWRMLGKADTFKLYASYVNVKNDTVITYMDATQDNKNQCFRVKAIFDTVNVLDIHVPSFSNIYCLKLINEPKIFNVFSPNGDGLNEFMFVDNIRSYPVNEMYVFNRWGNTVYHKVNYNNDWDGGDLPAGTYFYLFKINDQEEGKTYDFKGNVLIVR